MSTDDSLTTSKLIPTGFKPFCFSNRPDRIRISRHFSPRLLNQLFQQTPILNADGEPLADHGERQNLTHFLTQHSGEAVKRILEYVPHNFDGSRHYDPDLNLHHGYFVIGRIHLPRVDGFTARVSATSHTGSQASIKLSIPLFNAALRGRLSTDTGQAIEIDNGPVDLVIPGTYKVVRWQRPNGNHFYITELVRCGQLITKQPAENPFDTASGYEKLLRRTGLVSRIGTDDYPSNEGPMVTIPRTEKFIIGFHFPQLEQLDLPGLQVKCEATAQETIEIHYRIAPGKDYVMHNAMGDASKRFEHYWSSTIMTG